MKAKKFRVGNLVMSNELACNCKPDEILEIAGIGLDLDFTNGTTQNYVGIKPIPLNKEWINKFGFNDSEYKKGYTGVEFRTNMILDFVLTKPKFMGEWQESYCYDLGQHRFIPLKYVHELQNLFFAITSTELSVNQEVSV